MDIEQVPKKTMCCADCGNDDIVWRVWADEFDNISHSCEDNFVFCNDCDDEKRPIGLE